MKNYTFYYKISSYENYRVKKENLMFDKRSLSRMSRGMGMGVSKAKLSEAMFEILLQLPAGTKNLKEVIVSNMGFMAASRDINDAWNQAKRKAARYYPGKFILDDRNALQWNDGTLKKLDKKISTANFTKLNKLAESENCSVNEMVSILIKSYGKRKSLK